MSGISDHTTALPPPPPLQEILPLKNDHVHRDGNSDAQIIIVLLV